MPHKFIHFLIDNDSEGSTEANTKLQQHTQNLTTNNLNGEQNPSADERQFSLNNIFVKGHFIISFTAFGEYYPQWTAKGIEKPKRFSYKPF